MALALVPLLLIVPLLGKYLDLMQIAEVASRYVAFEGTVHHSSTGWKSDAALAEEVRRRHFSNSTALVRTADAAGDFDAHRNPVWRDHAGRPLLSDFGGQVSVGTSRSVFSLASDVRIFWDRGLGLPDDNFYTGTVTLRPNDVAGLQPFDALGLTISRRTSLLTDAWTARSTADVRNRVSRSPQVYPAAFADRLGEFQDIAMQFMRFFNDPPPVFGLQDWEVVPCDRLAGSSC